MEEENIYLNNDYYQYQLTGVLVHSGTSQSGHYYSYIKVPPKGLSEDDIQEALNDNNNKEKWYEFNDMYVSEFDIKNLKGECFGGEYHQTDSS